MHSLSHLLAESISISPSYFIYSLTQCLTCTFPGTLATNPSRWNIRDRGIEVSDKLFVVQLWALHPFLTIRQIQCFQIIHGTNIWKKPPVQDNEVTYCVAAEQLSFMEKGVTYCGLDGSLTRNFESWNAFQKYFTCRCHVTSVVIWFGAFEHGHCNATEKWKLIVHWVISRK